jgi:hypothetical protein
MRHWEAEAARIKVEFPNLIIGICDTGIGIMPNLINRLFPTVPRLILNRDMQEVENSLTKIDLELLDSFDDWTSSIQTLTDNIHSLRLHWTQQFSFDYMLLILQHLKINTSMCRDLLELRFNEFKKINCQPHLPLTSTSDSVSKVIHNRV